MSFGLGVDACAGDVSTRERGAASGKGFLSLGTESGKGLRIFITDAPPAAAGNAGAGRGGAGEAGSAEGAVLAETAGKALGAGDGLRAGEELFVDEDLTRLTAGAGFGGKLRISSTFCDETLNLIILRGRPSGCAAGSCGRGRFGGFMAPAPIPEPFDRLDKFIFTAGAAGAAGAGFGNGGGRAFGTGGSGRTNNGLVGFVRNLSESLKDTMPYVYQYERNHKCNS